MTAKASRWHGRIDGAAERCAVPGCGAPGEFRAPLTPSSFDGPGDWQYLCLDHVRAYNAAYDFFAGMSTEEIEAAQSPMAGWDRATRAFASNGANPDPAWADFSDPIDAIAARFPRDTVRCRPDRFTASERACLKTLGLGEDCDLHAVRKRYSQLVRRYHPDRNGGDRRSEGRLSQVIEAYKLLKCARAFR